MTSRTARAIAVLLLAASAPQAAVVDAEPGGGLVATVQGRASADGRALAAAEVRLVPLAALAAEPKADPAEGAAPVATTRTGDDGSFSLTAPGPGPWGVRIDAPGRVGQEIAIEVLEGTVRLPPVELPGARDLEVRVPGPELDAGVARVAWPSGRRVDALPVNRWRATPVAAVFGPGGTATLPVAADGEGEVQVVAPGFEIVRTEARGPLAVVELTPAPPVAVRVLDAGGSRWRECGSSTEAAPSPPR